VWRKWRSDECSKYEGRGNDTDGAGTAVGLPGDLRCTLGTLAPVAPCLLDRLRVAVEEGRQEFSVFRLLSARMTRGSKVLGERGDLAGRMALIRLSERDVNLEGGLAAILELPRTP
jgi:hypothetical protein